MMVADTSAIIAVLTKEQEGPVVIAGQFETRFIFLYE